MKNKILFIFIALAISFTACKKDGTDEQPETPRLSLQQKWKNTDAYTNYYDSLGSKVYTEKDTTLADIEFGTDFKGSISISDNSMIKSLSFKYLIQQKEEKRYLTITAASFGSDKLFIEKLDTSQLILSSDAGELGYYKDGSFYPASKSVYIQEYVKY